MDGMDSSGITGDGLPQNDLERAFNALVAKQKDYTTFFNYYDGDQPLLYTAQRLKQIFPGLDNNFTQNWIAVVIDACNDRVNLTGISAKDGAAKDRLKQLIEDNLLLLSAHDLHLAAQLCGEAFVIAQKDEATGAVQAFYNDPRMCHVEYDQENPFKKLWAAKWWDDDKNYKRITLYYPDRLEYYVSTKTVDQIQNAKAFTPGEPPDAPNTYNAIPVFHFRGSSRTIKGDVVNALPIQNAINKLLADMMIAAEFGAFRQRYIISNMDNTGQLKNAPNEIWTLPAGDGVGPGTTVGEFSTTDLQNYLTAMDSLAINLAAITRTPKHFFVWTRGDPSGEALVAMEAPLNKKAQHLIDHFIPTWRELCAFLLLLDGMTVNPHDLTPNFDDPSTVQPMTTAQVRQTTVAAGVPLVTALRWEGKSDADLAQMQKDQQAEAEQQKTTLAQAMLHAQRSFDQGQGAAPTQRQLDNGRGMSRTTPSVAAKGFAQQGSTGK